MKKVTNVPQENAESADILPTAEAPKKNNATYAIAAALFLIVIVGIGLVMQKKSRSVTQVADAPQNATPSPEDYRSTTLTVDSDAATVSSTMVSVPVQIDTAGNTVSAVEMHILVDPPTVKGLKVVPGSFFINPTVLENKAGKQPGTYVFTLGSLSPRQGSGDLVHISWDKTAGVAGSVTIAFDPQTQAAAIEQSATVLKQATGATVRY